ncbi:MAG: bacterial Ig-like domain-containing protein [Clostridia bacterium]|nr:bacterial Ig-like domain-containing protein [Clostridia bacterium]
MKKIKLAALLISLISLFFVFAVSSQAASVSVKATAEPLTRNTVALSLESGASYLTSMQLYVEYNPDVLTYVDYTVDTGRDNDFCIINTEAPGKLLVNFFAATHAFNTDMLTLHFSIADNASGEQTFKVSMKNVYAANDNTGLSSRSMAASEVVLNDAKFTVPTVQSLSLTYEPSAVFYIVNTVTELDFTSVVVRAQYTTEDFLVIPISDCTVNSTFNGSMPGVYPVSVSYKGFTASYMAVVGSAPDSIEIVSLPEKTKYTQNTAEALDLTGLELVANYGGDKQNVPISSVAVEGFDPTAATGKQTITLSFFGCEVQFDIEIVPEVRFAPGDVDMNGVIQAADARLALRAAVALETLNAEAFALADVDKNGVLQAADARLILRAAVGLETIA